MVGDSVEVTSRSYSPEEPGHTWKSTGSGSYEIGPVEGGRRSEGKAGGSKEMDGARKCGKGGWL
jgi:HSP90 family molecular chaperone